MIEFTVQGLATKTGTGGVGVSAETAQKHRQVGKVLPLILAVVKRALEKWGGRLRLIDLNAGCGRYEYLGEHLEGSPLIFADFVDGITVPHDVVLIEQKQEVADELIGNLLQGPARQRHFGGYCPEVLVGDNRDLAPVVCAKGSRRDKGLVFFDPNGEPDVDLAAQLSKLEAMKGVDFLLHIPASILKLDRCAAHSDRFGEKGKRNGKDVRPLLSRLRSIRKAHWMIRKPYGAMGWTLLYGTNYRFQNGWAKEGFYWTDTPEGQELLLRASFSESGGELGIVQRSGLNMTAIYEWVERAAMWLTIERAAGQRGPVNGEEPLSFAFALRETEGGIYDD